MSAPSGSPPESDSARRAARLAFVRERLGANVGEPIRASADAGFRSYWRSQRDAESFIVMDSPPAREDVRPWLALRDLLAAHGVRVPKLLAQDVENGFLLLEDLGGPTLLQSIDDANADAWFDKALAELVKLQSIPCPATLPGYDAALVQRELALFPQWYLGRHLGIALDDAEAAAWDELCAMLTGVFLRQPQVLVHRDYMPRNLMPLAHEVAVLDFQDAVRGPIAYDVLSLFKDAFLSWPQPRIDGWAARYLQLAGAANLPVPDAATFRRDLDLTGVQRHLKVLGIFARLHHRDGKPRYLEDAPRFLRYLGEVLPRYPELAALAALLRRLPQ